MKLPLTCHRLPLPLLTCHCHRHPDMRHEWTCIFSSQRNGKSFNTLMGKLSRCEAPSLLLVKDKAEGGALMGGFAPAPWRKNGAFFGDYSTFIFGLDPKMQVSVWMLDERPINLQSQSG